MALGPFWFLAITMAICENLVLGLLWSFRSFGVLWSVGHGPWFTVCGGYWSPPGPKYAGASGGQWTKVHPYGLGPLRGSRTIKNLTSSSTSPSHPPAKRFQSHIIPSTPRTSQSTLATIPNSFPPALPSSSTARPALIPEVRPSPIHHSRNSPIVTSQQLQPVASSSGRGEELSPLPFPTAQVFQKKDHWTIQVTREDPNTASENQDAVARFFKTVDTNSREVIEYVNDGTIPGITFEKMAAKFSWYEEELVNDLKRNFDNLGRDN
ncbi:hypothetical protein O181_028288 [Austropuccinia psidii MF-1]|uniref:Uncharacterized protein n=1 Tax=Austropuccinia psidii MF-1 TaxID=1389203 RepID=A0A9Q3H1N9_9BASI|nr:hypothetical protein [Austropuccinia psidii MF-1]